MKTSERLRWYGHRLRAMTPAEVVHRVADEGRHRTNGRLLRQLAGFELGAGVDSPSLPDPTAAPPELLRRLARDAAAIQSGEWLLFGWRKVNVGAPPCWHRDAVCGVVIDPTLPARRLNHRSLPDGADARTIWEINRWTEIARLGMHGWLNGDSNALKTAQEWLEDWCERNPPGFGINWTSPLEAALRLINFTWFDALVHAASARTGDGSLLAAQTVLARRIVPVHAAWVWRFRSAGSSANNHLLGELAALAVSVSRWPALAELACPAEGAWETLGIEILRQFAVDGGSREQALHYHAFAFELAWHALRSVGARRGPIYDRLLAAARFWLSVASAEEPWDYGDSDDAEVLPLALDRSQATAEWRSWMLGNAGALHFWLGAAPQPLPTPSAAGWHAHRDSGLAAFHGHDWLLRLDASPLGFGSLAAHGHCDALHLSVWDGGRALIIDPGTGGYYGHPALRNELAAWTAHNGPQPTGGFRTPLRLGPFLQSHPHAPPSLEVTGGEAVVRFHHENHAFTRRVSVENDGVVVKDVEEWGLPFQTRWYFAPECRVEPLTDGRFLVRRDQATWRLDVSGAGLQCRLERGWVSRAYSGQEETTVLSLSAAGLGLALRLVRQP